MKGEGGRRAGSTSFSTWGPGVLRASLATTFRDLAETSGETAKTSCKLARTPRELSVAATVHPRGRRNLPADGHQKGSRARHDWRRQRLHDLNFRACSGSGAGVFQLGAGVFRLGSRSVPARSGSVPAREPECSGSGAGVFWLGVGVFQRGTVAFRLGSRSRVCLGCGESRRGTTYPHRQDSCPFISTRMSKRSSVNVQPPAVNVRVVRR